MIGYINPKVASFLPKPESPEAVLARREKAAAEKGMTLAEYEAWQAEEARKAAAAESPDAWDDAL